MRIRTFLKPLSFIPAILLMYMIYTFSAQEGELSSSVSYKVSYHIVKAADYLLDTNLDEWEVQDYAVRMNGVTRKLAHMTEYFLLAVAVSFPLYVYGLHGILLLILAGGFCVAFACGDEYHQSFVAGRAASHKDVIIDSIGIFIGIILVRIIGWTGRHTVFKPVEDDGYRRMSRREMKKIKKRQRQIEQDMRLAQQRQFDEQVRRRQEENARLREQKARQARDLGDTRPYRKVTDDTIPYRIRRHSDGQYYDEYEGRYDEGYRDDFDEGYRDDFDERYRDDFDERYRDDFDERYRDDDNRRAMENTSDDLASDMPLAKILRKR